MIKNNDIMRTAQSEEAHLKDDDHLKENNKPIKGESDKTGASLLILWPVILGIVIIAFIIGSWTAQANAMSLGDTGGGGGKVFYIATTTYLEVAPTDWNGGVHAEINWSTGGNQSLAVSGADGTALFTGQQNSLDIYNQSGNVITSCGAIKARSYQGGGLSDWYLPSKDEIVKLKDNLSYTDWIIDGHVWWTSSEISNTIAWVMWDNGTMANWVSKDSNGRIIPIRTGTIETATTTAVATASSLSDHYIVATTIASSGSILFVDYYDIMPVYLLIVLLIFTAICWGWMRAILKTKRNKRGLSY